MTKEQDDKADQAKYEAKMRAANAKYHRKYRSRYDLMTVREAKQAGLSLPEWLGSYRNDE